MQLVQASKTGKKPENLTEVTWTQGRVVTPPALLMDGTEPLCLYLPCPEGLGALHEAVRRVRYDRDWRTEGLPTNSRVFGYEPRKQLRKDYCSATALAREMPAEHALICGFAAYLADLYCTYIPQGWSHHYRTVAESEELRQEYVLPGGLFTSGIINKNNQLRYHLDRGNQRDLWSAMVVLRDDTDGGFLVMPEYELALDCAHGTVVIFPGQRVWHGVTPILRHGVHAARYSLVYYALKAMWRCLSIDDELARIRTKKTEREKRRLTHMTDEPAKCDRCGRLIEDMKRAQTKVRDDKSLGFTHKGGCPDAAGS